SRSACSRSLISDTHYNSVPISLFYLAAWVTFRLFPVLIGTGGVEYFIIISMSVTVNSSANAFVYITSNEEVKSVLSSRNLSSTVLHTIFLNYKQLQWFKRGDTLVVDPESQCYLSLPQLLFRILQMR
ncbi:hypothetical protein OSTOST_22503, partial [Ostertagia ostertagi]